MQKLVQVQGGLGGKFVCTKVAVQYFMGMEMVGQSKKLVAKYVPTEEVTSSRIFGLKYFKFCMKWGFIYLEYVNYVHLAESG